jgi:hypothetical protein
MHHPWMHAVSENDWTREFLIGPEVTSPKTKALLNRISYSVAAYRGFSVGAASPLHACNLGLYVSLAIYVEAMTQGG